MCEMMNKLECRMVVSSRLRGKQVYSQRKTQDSSRRQSCVELIDRGIDELTALRIELYFAVLVSCFLNRS